VPAHIRNPSFESEEVFTSVQGKAGTAEWRMFFHARTKQGPRQISPWHNIPLIAGFSSTKAPLGRPSATYINTVIEIPKGADAKMEISTSEPFNPIKQDVKNGKLRVLKHGPLDWNYGAAPQTWEDPRMNHHGVQLKGDDDPLDIIEIGDGSRQVGQVVKVKVLGALCLIDEGEQDWKVITLNVDDPRIEKVHDVADLQFHFPGLIDSIREYYRVYKVVDGKQPNTFAFNGECLPQRYASEVVEDTHNAWLKYTQMERVMQLGEEPYEFPDREEQAITDHARVNAVRREVILPRVSEL